MAKLISFSGSDGTGKTTLGKKLFEYYKEKGEKVVYRVEFDYFLLRYLIKLYSFLFSKKNLTDIRKNFVKNKLGWKNKLIPYLIYIDLLLEFFYYKILKRGIVIIDRHVIDFIIGWRLIGITTPFLEKLFLSFPKLNTSFLLLANPKIAFERKKHEQTNELQFFIKLRGWSEELGQQRKNIIIVNTDASQDHTFAQIIKNIAPNPVIPKFFIYIFSSEI